MEKTELMIYSLTTNYPESQNPKTAKFVHEINKELVKLGCNKKTITLHTEGASTKDEMDSVSVIRFRYLPEKHQFNYTSIPDEISKSKKGYLKMIIMTFFFFMNTLFPLFASNSAIIVINEV